MPITNQIPNDPRNRFAPRFLPWLLGAAALVFYWSTLNRWVTLANILPVAKVSGFLWQPELAGPLMYLATLPFRWLPAAHIPAALNLFSAVCAALTLGLLARCVAILPHDRTEMERTRERSDFTFLTVRSAWVPPAFAAVMLGLNFGFWQAATSFTGDMLDLLLFATVVWLLLEYRLDERPGRLTLAAFVCGAGIPENWAMLGFLPLFVVAVIWLRKLEFFNARFLSRMALCGLAGMLLFLLLPLVAKFSGSAAGMTVWQMLKLALKQDWQVLKAVQYGEVRHNLAFMSLTTLLPLLLMAIRWSSSFGDSSRIGAGLANYMFHLINAVMLGVCIWVMFDPPFSPGQLAFGSPALTFYFLSALAAGYFAGYFILVFGRKGISTRRNPNPLPALPGQLEKFSPLVYFGVCAAAAIGAATLAYKNLPQIRAINDRTLLHYAQLTEQMLPPGGGILLSDAEILTSSQQARTLLLQAALARSGRDKDYLVVDTPSLNYAPYLRHLHRRAPKIWPQMVDDKYTGNVSPLGQLGALSLLAKSNNICYLNPSYGFYFEYFYQEPHGLAYQMKPLPEDTLLPPPPATKLVDENQKFWAQAAQQEFPRLLQTISQTDTATNLNLAGWLLGHLHGQAEPNPNAVFAANLYSRALDFWGVELQRAGRLDDAAAAFAYAAQLNPENVVATINLDFNRALLAGTAASIDPDRATTDAFGKYRNWNAVLNGNGPFDEPSFVFANALLLGQAGYTRQAVAPFNRVRQLAPDNLPARLWLAQMYLFNRLPAPALEALRDPLLHPARFGLTDSNSTEINILAAAGHFQKSEVPQGVALMEVEISRHPDDATLLTAATQAYFVHGLYTNALHLINRQLARQPDDPQWLSGLGYAWLQLSNYDRAISAYTRVLAITTNNPPIRFNRALANLQAGRLDDARADYTELQSAFTNAYQVAYGLAEIAWRQRQTNEAVRNCELYLANAPTNTAEYQSVRERLRALQR